MRWGELTKTSAIEVAQKYSGCVVPVSSESSDGDQNIGSAFHIGDGWLVTARHVVEDRFSIQVGGVNKHTVHLGSDVRVDLALIESDFEADQSWRSRTPMPAVAPEDHIQIGEHLTDRIVGDSFLLMETVTMGYPPIPMSREAFLYVSRGEVNAVVDKYMGISHPYFVTSPVPRGGMSGGPVLVADRDGHDYLLGVQVESLVRDHEPMEAGFGAALAVEPLWGLLKEVGVFPASHARFAREMGWLK